MVPYRRPDAAFQVLEGSDWPAIRTVALIEINKRPPRPASALQHRINKFVRQPELQRLGFAKVVDIETY